MSCKRVCKECSKPLTLGKFYKRKGCVGGYSPKCKTCKPRNYVKEYAYANNKYATNAKWRAEKIRKSARNISLRERRDPAFRMRRNLRKRLRRMLRGGIHARTRDIIGCTQAELKCHIESHFLPGMCWDNMGKWHVDHIIPMCAFDVMDPMQRNIVMWYENLQPLWAKDNLAKGGKYKEEDKLELIHKYIAKL